MVDILDSRWTEEDEANIAPSPDGIQNGYAPKTIGPIIRSIRAAVKRQTNRINARYKSTGTGAAYALEFEVPLPVYSEGERIAFYAHTANTGPATLDISGLGVKTLLRSDGAPLTPNEIKAGAFVEVAYNGSAFNVVGYSQPTNVNVVGDLTVGGKVTANSFISVGDISTTGKVTASILVGNGSAITAIDPQNLSVVVPVSKGGTGASAAVDARVNLGIDTELAKKLDKTGGTVSGALTLNYGSPRYSLTDTTLNKTRSLLNQDDLIGFTGSDGNWNFRVADTGAVWTKQFGDLNTFIETRASAQGQAWSVTRVAKTGDTMTGQLVVDYRNATLSINGDNRQWYIQAQDDGGSSLRVVDVNANAEAFKIGTDGSLWCRQLGDINSRIESRASAWRNDAIANIMPTIAAQGAGGVGTYAFLQYDAAGVNPGDQVSGGSCRWSDRDTGSPVVGYGSWRAMGWSQGARNSTLFMRYA